MKWGQIEELVNYVELVYQNMDGMGDIRDIAPSPAQNSRLRIVDRKLPGLVNIQKAIENGHRNSEFSH